MVAIQTNRTEYANDIAEEMRLFLGFTDISLNASPEAEWTLTVELFENDGQCCVRASARGLHYENAFRQEGGSRLARKKLEKRHIKLAAYHLMRDMFPAIQPPWGSLTGIRPTKLFRELSDAAGDDAAATQFLDVFCVTPEKTVLARRITRLQRETIDSAGPRDLDIYVGIPYCRTRCLYCSFGSVIPKRPEDVETYLHTLYEDIRLGALLASDGGYRVRAAYIGGGTPTILSAGQLDALLTHMKRCYGSLGAELTVEAGRPDTIDREKLLVLRAHETDRISINPQTMNDETLRRVGRSHNAADTVAAFELARALGFSWINMDLIAGLPGERTAQMEHSCKEILRLGPDNLTVHALAVKRSSRLKLDLDAYALPGQEDAGAMIRLGAETAEALGMLPYYMYRQKYMSGNLENVGYARPERICRYNIDMMEESVSILAHGAGAMSKRLFSGENRIERIPAPKDVPAYIQKLPQLDERKRRQFLD